MTPRIVRPCRRLPAPDSASMVPKVRVSATGISSRARIDSRLASGVGFSNGCAELAPRTPPPLVPRSLSASWEATGAVEICCAVPSRAVTATPPDSDWIMPWVRNSAAKIRPRGSNTRTTARVRSTQKLPITLLRTRQNPRTTATATAIPTAAETKFCTVSPIIWVRLVRVCSGVYDCQLVLVTKEAAVLNAMAGSTASWRAPSGGSQCWTRWIT